MKRSKIESYFLGVMVGGSIALTHYYLKDLHLPLLADMLCRGGGALIGFLLGNLIFGIKKLIQKRR